MERVMRIPEVVAVTGLSRTTLWRLERAEKFPKRVQLSTHAVGYYASAITAWLESREEVSTSSDTAGESVSA